MQPAARPKAKAKRMNDIDFLQRRLVKSIVNEHGDRWRFSRAWIFISSFYICKDDKNE